LKPKKTTNYIGKKSITNLPKKTQRNNLPFNRKTLELNKSRKSAIDRLMDFVLALRSTSDMAIWQTM
jgi:hypothetical protein